VSRFVSVEAEIHPPPIRSGSRRKQSGDDQKVAWRSQTELGDEQTSQADGPRHLPVDGTAPIDRNEFVDRPTAPVHRRNETEEEARSRPSRPAKTQSTGPSRP